MRRVSLLSHRVSKAYIDMSKASACLYVPGSPVMHCHPCWVVSHQDRQAERYNAGWWLNAMACADACDRVAAPCLPMLPLSDSSPALAAQVQALYPIAVNGTPAQFTNEHAIGSKQSQVNVLSSI